MDVIKEAFKLGKKDVKNFIGTVKQCDEDADDGDCETFLIWCAGDTDLRDALATNGKTWQTYLALSKKFRSGKTFTDAMTKRSDTDILSAANYELTRGKTETKTGPSKEERTEINRKEREERERLEKLKEAEEQQKKLEEEKKQKQEDRRLAANAYSAIAMGNAIAQAAWDAGVDEYVRAGRGNIGMSEAHGREDLVTALTAWKAKAAAVAKIGKENDGPFKGLSKFPKPQNKKDEGKGNVGDTLAKRETQANFIIFLSNTKGGPSVNVHIDMT